MSETVNEQPGSSEEQPIECETYYRLCQEIGGVRDSIDAGNRVSPAKLENYYSKITAFRRMGKNGLAACRVCPVGQIKEASF